MWWGDDDPPTGCADLLDVNGHVVPAALAGGRLSTRPPSACSGIGTSSGSEAYPASSTELECTHFVAESRPWRSIAVSREAPTEVERCIASRGDEATE